MARKAKFTSFLSIMVEPAAKQALEAYADQTDLAVSDVVRKILDDGIAEIEAQLEEGQ